MEPETRPRLGPRRVDPLDCEFSFVKFLSTSALIQQSRSIRQCSRRRWCSALVTSQAPLYRDEVEPNPTLRGWDLFRHDLHRMESAIRHRGQREYLRYDAEAISEFYDGRPWAVVLRLMDIGLPLVFWYIRYVLYDRFGKKENGDDAMIRIFAEELREIIVGMGPIPVKIGQGLSSRPDVVTSAVFLAELQKLQDCVGSFDSNVARSIIEDELGAPLHEVFEEMTDEPVASASLGQVYRGKIRKTKREVAVKVQRPGIGYQAGIDLYLLRKFASLLRRQLNLRSDLESIADEFSSRVFSEIDYNREAENCARFHRLYSGIEGVTVPLPVFEWTTRRVLTLDWIEGTREPWGDDSLRLIDIGIQCTLRQLLDSGFFHADPHGGNLLRTTDGNLAFLDFGMMSELDEQKRIDLISSIVHFINRDYELLSRDFVRLEFLPKGTSAKEMQPLLEKAIGDATEGGGASKLSFARLASNMASIARISPIRLPPYYSLVIRSLTILEGIALKVDPEFKIVDKAYPYVSKRFLEDESPELRAALAEVLIDQTTQRLRWKRLNSLLEASAEDPEKWFQSQSSRNEGFRLSESAVKRIVNFVLSGKAEFLREVLINELVETVDALQLDAAARVSRASRGFLPPPIESANEKQLEIAHQVFDALQKLSSQRLIPKFAERPKLSKPAPVDIERGAKVTKESTEIAREVVGRIASRNTRRFWKSVLDRIDSFLDIERHE